MLGKQVLIISKCIQTRDFEIEKMSWCNYYPPFNCPYCRPTVIVRHHCFYNQDFVIPGMGYSTPTQCYQPRVDVYSPPSPCRIEEITNNLVTPGNSEVPHEEANLPEKVFTIPGQDDSAGALVKDSTETSSNIAVTEICGSPSDDNDGYTSDDEATSITSSDTGSSCEEEPEVATVRVPVPNESSNAPEESQAIIEDQGNVAGISNSVNGETPPKKGMQPRQSGRIAFKRAKTEELLEGASEEEKKRNKRLFKKGFICNRVNCFCKA